MTPLSDAALALIDQHLASSGFPYEPDHHYDTYAPAAFMVIGSQVLPKADASRQVYVSAWQNLLATLPPEAHGPTLTRQAIHDAVIEDRHIRISLTVNETASGRSWRTAWLLEGPSDAPLLRAVCPLDGPLPDAETIIARGLAELGHWGNHFEHPVWPISPLGIALIRLTDHEPRPLETLPEARFTCQNRGDCCQMGTWQIPVDPNTQRAMAAIPWPALGRRGPRIAAGPATSESPGAAYSIAANGHGDCEAHVDGHCTVHQTIGWQPIHPCQTFPYQFQLAPDAIIVTASHLCLTVGDNQGKPLQEQQADIHSRLRPIRHLLVSLPEAIPLDPNGPTIPWHRYRQLEALVLTHLADRSRGDLPDRVLTVSQRLADLVTQAKAGHDLPEDWTSWWRQGGSPAANATDQAAEAWMRHFTEGGEWERAHRRPFDGWQRKAWALSRQERLAGRRDDELATRYLRTVLFRKLGLGKFGLAFSWGVTAFAACLWDRHTVYRHLQAGVPADRTLQLDTARRLDHSLMHTPLLQAIADDPAMVAQLCDPATWLSFAAVSG